MVLYLPHSQEFMENTVEIDQSAKRHTTGRRGNTETMEYTAVAGVDDGACQEVPSSSSAPVGLVYPVLCQWCVYYPAQGLRVQGYLRVKLVGSHPSFNLLLDNGIGWSLNSAGQSATGYVWLDYHHVDMSNSADELVLNEKRPRSVA